MFHGIRGKFSLDVLLKFSSDEFEVFELGGSKYLRDKAILAIQAPQGKGEFKKVLASGELALIEKGKPRVSLHYPFKHPRMCVANFQIAEKLVQTVIRRFHEERWWTPAPRIALQPTHNTLGGLTDIEQKMLTELGLSAGAREVVIITDSAAVLNKQSFQSLVQNFGSSKR